LLLVWLVWSLQTAQLLLLHSLPLPLRCLRLWQHRQ
jgi:hypothetical protein